MHACTQRGAREEARSYPATTAFTDYEGTTATALFRLSLPA